jgi:electron-transferring-flavoprotein dehydrogenase
MTREQMEFDVIIVGAGPAGLAAAIRLGQLSQLHNLSLTICLIEKGVEVGAHILSGAVLEPRALNELLPDWLNTHPELITPVTDDEFCFLTAKKSYSLPTAAPMNNHGNYIISLSQLCRELAVVAENLGINIFPGFAGTEILFENNIVRGIVTGDMGIDKNNQPTSRFQPGMELRAKQVLFAEGCRGSLAQKLLAALNLTKNCDPQTYALGFKEVWEISPDLHHAGRVLHTIGWPLKSDTYGGSFVYHANNNLLALGLVVGLDYQNPYLNPYEEFQRFKTHPKIAPLLKNAKRIAYGARALNEGGIQSIPKLSFPGGLLIGCAAGFLNVPKIKGIHTAMKSGMIAAENIYPLLTETNPVECLSFQTNLEKSWLWEELQRARNIRPAMRWGLIPGLAYAAIDHYLLRGKAPWTFHHPADYKQLKDKKNFRPINYPSHDNVITFDLTSSVFLTNNQHDENQPCHLKLKNPQHAISVNFKKFASPETRYCPAGVYEIINAENQPKLQINAANCIQCKACDIKDPMQNIVWTPPEGGCGPRYRVL